MSDKYNGPLIRAVNVKKNFGDQEVLKGIDLEVNEGDVVVIIGPSGSLPEPAGGSYGWPYFI